MVTTTPFMEQTPQLSLHEIADRLWVHKEYAAYRALLAYTKERDALLAAVKEQT